MLILDLRGFAQSLLEIPQGRRKGAKTQREDLHNKRKISLKLFFLRVLRFFVVHCFPTSCTNPGYIVTNPKGGTTNQKFNADEEP
jgi:hypothetical protein